MNDSPELSEIIEQLEAATAAIEQRGRAIARHATQLKIMSAALHIEADRVLNLKAQCDLLLQQEREAAEASLRAWEEARPGWGR